MQPRSDAGGCLTGLQLAMKSNKNIRTGLLTATGGLARLQLHILMHNNEQSHKLLGSKPNHLCFCKYCKRESVQVTRTDATFPKGQCIVTIFKHDELQVKKVLRNVPNIKATKRLVTRIVTEASVGAKVLTITQYQVTMNKLGIY